MLPEDTQPGNSLDLMHSLISPFVWVAPEKDIAGEVREFLE